MTDNDFPKSVEEAVEKRKLETDDAALYEEKVIEDSKNLPPIYKKILPVIASGFYPFIMGVPKIFISLLTKGLISISDFWESRQRNNWAVKEQYLRDKSKAPQVVINNLKEIHDFSPLLALPLYIIFIILGGVAHFSGYIKQLMMKVEYSTNKETPLTLTSPDVVISALIKRMISDSTADDMLDKLGITKPARESLVGAIKQIVPEDVLINNYYREKIDFSELMTQLSRKGYDVDQQTFWNNVIDKIPPIQDIISMAVREAFNPMMIELFGYADEFPPDFAEAGKKHGFSEDWLLKYWIAHWRLPSPEMVFEMLHRGLIDESHVDIYLKAADYPRYWRDAMKGISYQPLTRVDVRRMYRIGVFDDIEGMDADQAVVKAYQDLGYNEYNAKLMLIFTKKFEGEEKKKLTESKITKLFRIGMIDETKTRDLLSKLKLRPEYVDYIVDLVQYETDEELLDALLNTLRKKYVIGRISKADVLTALSRESSVPVDTTVMFRIWDYERDGIRRLPSRADVIRWFRNGSLSRVQTIQRLFELGYSKPDAELYVKEVTGD